MPNAILLVLGGEDLDRLELTVLIVKREMVVMDMNCLLLRCCQNMSQAGVQVDWCVTHNVRIQYSAEMVPGKTDTEVEVEQVQALETHHLPPAPLNLNLNPEKMVPFSSASISSVLPVRGKMCNRDFSPVLPAKQSLHRPFLFQSPRPHRPFPLGST
jgi:hypothetical protein